MRYQVQNELGKVKCTGRSKHLDKRKNNGFHPYGIYSQGTFSQYVEHCTRFAEWCKKEYGCKTLQECKTHVTDYLDDYSKRNRVTSLHTVKYAIQKLYDVSDHGYRVLYETPTRRRIDIVKNRTPISEVKGFDEQKWNVEIKFGYATGARRSALLNLLYRDICEENGEVYVTFFKDKGGKTRTIKIMPQYKDFIRSFINKGCPDENVIKRIPTRFPEHTCRRHYANEYYSLIARKEEEIPKEDRYICRNDKKGIIYDRKAMLEVSAALGHGRVDVMALHYLE